MNVQARLFLATALFVSAFAPVAAKAAEPSNPPLPPLAAPSMPPIYPYTPRSPYEEPHLWGVQLHLDGTFAGAARQGTTLLGGLGAGVRYKPIPYFGIEADATFSGGADSDHDSRSEMAAGFNAYAYVNPRSRAQLYFVLDTHFINADVRGTPSIGDTNLKYIGAGFGPGFEFRLNPHVAIMTDVRAHIRARVDGGATDYARQIDLRAPTKVSGGISLRAGFVFYF